MTSSVADILDIATRPSSVWSPLSVPETELNPISLEALLAELAYAADSSLGQPKKYNVAKQGK